jgi:hypothetical protein
VIAANKKPMTIGEYLMRLSKSGEEPIPRLLTVLCQHLDSSAVTKKGRAFRRALSTELPC